MKRADVIRLRAAGDIGPYQETTNVTRRRGGYYPPAVLSAGPLISLALLDSFPPEWGSLKRRFVKAFPTQGGRWPFGVPNVTQRKRSRWGEDEQRSE